MRSNLLALTVEPVRAEDLQRHIGVPRHPFRAPVKGDQRLVTDKCYRRVGVVISLAVLDFFNVFPTVAFITRDRAAQGVARTASFRRPRPRFGVGSGIVPEEQQIAGLRDALDAVRDVGRRQYGWLGIGPRLPRSVETER